MEIPYLAWDEIELLIKSHANIAPDKIKNAIQKYGKNINCPKCLRSAEYLSWYYYRSPEDSWKHLAGRAGWCVVCVDCREKIKFFLEIMS